MDKSGHLFSIIELFYTDDDDLKISLVFSIKKF